MNYEKINIGQLNFKGITISMENRI
jgi:hypothetical protein